LPDSHTRVAVVTLSYNGAQSAGSLVTSSGLRDLPVLVVDNGSVPYERDALRRTCASRENVTVIESAENLGFSGGNNIGIRAALDRGAEWVLLLNDDTTVDDEFGDRLRELLAHAAPGIVSLPLEEDGRIVRAGRRQWLRRELTVHPDPDGADDAYAIGASMAVHRDVFTRVGTLDEAYFLYFEDVDFSERVRHAGFPIVFAPAPVVRHARSASARRLGAPVLARYHARNAIRFNRRLGPPVVRAAAVPWGSWIVASQRVRIALGRESRRARAVIAGVADARSDRDGRIDPHPVLAIDGSSLAGTRWGVGRLTGGLVDELRRDPALSDGLRVVLHTAGPLATPDGGWGPIEVRNLRPARGARASSLLDLLVRLPRAVRRDHADVVYLPGYLLPPFLGAASIVMLTEDVLESVHDRTIPWRDRLIYRWLAAGRARRRSDRILAISAASASALARAGVPAERIVVAPIGIDPPRAVALDPDPVDFLWVGQAFERRHLREALRAFTAIVADRAVTFRIIGPDRYGTPTIGALVARANTVAGREAVRWDEYVDEDTLATALAGARALVYVSETEAFGLPPLEALSRGVPAVTADTPVSREVLGDHAFWVKTPVTERGIHDAMVRALDDAETRERILIAAPAVLERATWARHARLLIAAVRDLAER